MVMPKCNLMTFLFSLFHKRHAAKYSTSRQVRVYCKKKKKKVSSILSASSSVSSSDLIITWFSSWCYLDENCVCVCMGVCDRSVDREHAAKQLLRLQQGSRSEYCIYKVVGFFFSLSNSSSLHQFKAECKMSIEKVGHFFLTQLHVLLGCTLTE